MENNFNKSIAMKLMDRYGVKVDSVDVGCIGSLRKLGAQHMSKVSKVFEMHGPVVACLYLQCILDFSLHRWPKVIVNDVLMNGEEFDGWIKIHADE